MSDGKIHNSATIISSFGLGFYNLYQTSDPKTTLALIIGGMANLLINGDWDVDNGSRSDYHARKFGLGWLFYIIRMPYSRAYKHRSFITHFPIISTIFRLLYVYFPTIIIFTQNQHPGSRKHTIELLLRSLLAQLLVIVLIWIPTWYFWSYLVYYREYLVYALFSLIIADSLHWIFDKLF